MLLTIDIGNTSVGGMLFRDRVAVHSFRFATPGPGTSQPWSVLSQAWPGAAIGAAIVSSVVPELNDGLTRFLRDRGVNPRFLDHCTPLEIDLAVDDPAEVGADRIADAVGALEFASPPLLVIDSGTALTVDVVDADLRYLGGVIAPGAELSIRCLAAHAARLEPVDFKIPASPLASNTADCIRAGVYYTHLGGLKLLVKEYRRMVGEKAAVVATGGAAGLFRRDFSQITHFVPDLIHHGLRRIHENWENPAAGST